MAQFFTDFSEYKTGSPPYDWHSGWVEGDQRFMIVNDKNCIGGKVLQHEVFSHNRRAWFWDAIPKTENIEILTKLRSNNPNSRFGIIGRGGGNGQRGTEEGVTCELFNGEIRDLSSHDLPKQELRSTLFLVSYNPSEELNRGAKRPHGIAMIRGEAHYPWTPGSWQWIRLRIVDINGSVSVSARVWADGESEPSFWKYDLPKTEPSSILKTGFVGITGQIVGGIREYDIFSVGTNGDPAALPKSISK